MTPHNGGSMVSVYNAANQKTLELDPNNYSTQWVYNARNQLTEKIDLGGAKIIYRYDTAGQLIRQTSTRGQNLSFFHNAAGQLIVRDDHTLNNSTSYSYDLAGRRIRERTTQSGITYQDNHLAWDAQGNLRSVMDARVSLLMDYDAAGNRTRIRTLHTRTDGNSIQSDRHNQFDSANRQIVADAIMCRDPAAVCCCREFVCRWTFTALRASLRVGILAPQGGLVVGRRLQKTSIPLEQPGFYC